MGEAAKTLEVSEQTLHRWRNTVRRDEGPRREAARRSSRRRTRQLKRIVADKDARSPRLQGDCEGKILSPSRRRQAVCMLQDRLGLSERRACRITGQNRSTQRHQPQGGPRRRRRCANACARSLDRAAPLGLPPRPRPSADRGLVAEPKAGGSGSGARRACGCLPRPRSAAGWATPPVPAKRLRAEYPNHVWALDFQHDATAATAVS